MSVIFPGDALLLHAAVTREHREDCQCSRCMDDVTWMSLYGRDRGVCPYCGAQDGQPHHGGCEEVGRDD